MYWDELDVWNLVQMLASLDDQYYCLCWWTFMVRIRVRVCNQIRCILVFLRMNCKNTGYFLCSIHCFFDQIPIKSNASPISQLYFIVGTDY